MAALNLKSLDKTVQINIQENEAIVKRAHTRGLIILEELRKSLVKNTAPFLPMYLDGKDVSSKIRAVAEKEKRKFSKELIKRTMPFFDEVILNYKQAFQQLNELTEAEALELTDEQINDSMKAFAQGYISNIEGLMFNGVRGFLEGLDDLMIKGEDINEINDYLNAFDFNKNIYTLSQTAHLRAIYRFNLWKSFSSVFDYWRLDVDENKIKEMAKTGAMLSNWMFVRTIEQWKLKQKNETNPVNGLGLHYNSTEYYSPIPNEAYKESIAWSKKRRKDFFGS